MPTDVRLQVPMQNLKLTNERFKDETEVRLKEVLATNCFVLGPKLEQFEAEFASLCQVKYCIGVGNGTDAIAMALWGLGIKPGDEVILPSYTFIATAHAVKQVGAVPIFVDIVPKYFMIDPVEVEKAITESTRAIIAVNLFGHACDYVALSDISKRYNIPLVEDNAQAQGATYGKQKCGGIGKVNATSFYPTKNLGGIGDGGAITTNDHKIAKALFEYRNLGMRTPGIAMVTGRNSRLDELQAAFLSIKLDHLKELNAERTKIAAAYTERLSHLYPVVEVPGILNNTEPVWHHYVILTDHRDLLKIYLKNNGIDSTIYFKLPCHLQKPYIEQTVTTLPVSEETAARALALPCYPGLKEMEIDYVCARINEFIKQCEPRLSTI